MVGIMSKISVYKMPGEIMIWKKGYSVKTISEDDLDSHLTDGWRESPQEAQEVFESIDGSVSATKTPLDGKTREELEAIAESMEGDNPGLNIKYNAATKDASLRKKIIEAKESLESGGE
jgi:hypothetical protein